MKPLKATATTSKPVLTLEQIDTIFFMIQDIFEIHKEFYDALSPNIQQWDEKVTVGHLFQKLVSARRQRCAPSMLSIVGRAVNVSFFGAFVVNKKCSVEVSSPLMRVPIHVKLLMAAFLVMH